MMGAPGAPKPPGRSGRPGEAGTPLGDALGSGAPGAPTPAGARPPAGRSAALAALLAGLAAAPVLFVALGRAPFDDPGEGMHAEIARALQASGDPFALTFGGVAYVDKPPLLYVLEALAFTLAGPSEAAARAVPALGGLAAVAATAWTGARLLGGGLGLVAGLALLTSPLFFAFARYVRPESLFVAALAVGFAWLLVGLAEGRRAVCGAGLAAFGLAGLAKDPLGALGPPAALGVALVLAGRARPLGRWLPWWGVLAGLALAFGWWLAVEARTPGFVWYTVVDNHVLNVLGARRFADEDVPLGAAEFLAVATLGAAPWSLGAAVTMGRLIRDRAWRAPRETPWVALALWTVGVLGLTALSAFRLPHYGLPASGALALLAARAWTRGGRPLIVAHAALLAAAALGCAILWADDGTGVAGTLLGLTDVATRKSAAAGLTPAWAHFRPLAGAAALALGAGAVALGVTAWARLDDGRRRARALFFLIAALLVTLPSVAAATALVAHHRSVREIGQVIRRQAAPEDLVVHEGPLENSGALAWYAGRRAVIVGGERSVLGFGATRPEARTVFWDPGRLAAAWGSGRTVWIVSVRPPEQSVVRHLPGAHLVYARAQRTLWSNALR